MVLLLETDLPLFVKGSAYLQSLQDNGPFPDAGIEVPSGCAKKDLTVNSASDLTELLRTVQFWMVPDVLETCSCFLHFAFDPQNNDILNECAAEYELTIPFVGRVASIARASPIDGVKQALFYGYVHVLYVMFDEMNCEVKGGIVMAAEAGQARCMEFFHSLDEALDCEVATAAAKANSLPCLMYIREWGEWDKEALIAAATNGSLECVQFMVQNGCPFQPADLDKMFHFASKGGHLPVVEYLWHTCRGWCTFNSEDRVTMCAAGGGHVHLLQFAYAQSFQYLSTPTSAVGLMSQAVTHGHVNCLEYLYSVGQVADENVFVDAAHSGHVPSIRFLLDHNCPVNPALHPADYMLRNSIIPFDEMKLLFEAGVPWDEMTMATLAENGNLEGMQYLRERGCPWDEWTCNKAARAGHLHCLQYAHENGCPWKTHDGGPPAFDWPVAECAAKSASIECLKYVVDHGVPLTSAVLLRAMQGGAFTSLEYLLSVNCPVDEENCDEAARMGSVKILRLLREHHCPWDAGVCRVAAERGALEVLRFAHENGCPWDATVCAAAASKGSLECLQYAHTNDCPWDEMTCAGAAIAKSYEILKYARDNGCPWDARTCSAAAAVPMRIEKKAGDEEIALEFLKFLRGQGCPWDEETCRTARSRTVYEYAVAHGCPGAELSRFNNPSYVDYDFGTLAYLNE